MHLLDYRKKWRRYFRLSCEWFWYYTRWFNDSITNYHTRFSDYTLHIGQEKLSYEFVFRTKEFSEEDYYYSDEEDEQEEQEEQEPIEEENMEELEDELWEQYMDFLKFGKQRKYFNWNKKK